MNFSNVASDKPSMFMASLLTNNVNALIFFAGHSGFVQYRDCTSLIALIWVAPPHTGQTAGISTLSLPVRFSAIWGIIIFAL